MKKDAFIRVDSDLHHKVKIKAAEMRLTIGGITEQLLYKWLQEQISSEDVHGREK